MPRYPENFISKLVKTLITAFLKSSESCDSDACAYTLQEVLKTYKIGGSKSASTVGKRIWGQCSDWEKEVLTPFLTSLYSRTERSCTFTVPIYQAKSGMTYHDWLANWYCHLIQKLEDVLKDVEIEPGKTTILIVYDQPVFPGILQPIVRMS